MTSRMIDFLAAMFTTAAIIFLAVGSLITVYDSARTNTRISVVNESLNIRITVLVSQVRELQTRVTRIEGRQVLGE